MDFRAESVDDEGTLRVFIEQLIADLRATPESWENATLDRYSDALVAWVKDTDAARGRRDQAGLSPLARAVARFVSTMRDATHGTGTEDLAGVLQAIPDELNSLSSEAQSAASWADVALMLRAASAYE